MKMLLSSSMNKQFGFGKPAVILFLLLVLSLVAAAYCFVESNRRADKNHQMAQAVAAFRINSAHLFLGSLVTESNGSGANRLAIGDQLLMGLKGNDDLVSNLRVPDKLLPELGNVAGAWENFKKGLQLREKIKTEKPTAIPGSNELDTLQGLNGSLGHWLVEVGAENSVVQGQNKVTQNLMKLSHELRRLGPSPSLVDRTALAELWRALGSAINATNDVNDPDAKVLVDELRLEFDRLNPRFALPRPQSEIEQSTLASQYGKNTELQFLLEKMQQGLVVLEHEQNYLFRLGVVAALTSLLFLFILAIVFWKDAQQKLAQSSQSNSNNQRAILRLLDEITDLAEGDLTTRATVTEDITGALADSVNYAIDTLRELVMTMDDASVRVANSAKETGNTAKRLSRASNLQEREVRRSSNYIAAMAKTTKQMAQRSVKARDIANQSVLKAQSGYVAATQTMEGMSEIREQIQDTSKRLKRLGESSQQIGEIISLVNDIAERTNLLALNAAIQASSSNSQSSVFSPVADEVQALAECVDGATRDIEALVVTIQADTRAAINSMEKSTEGVVKGAELAEQAGVSLSDIQLVSRDLSERIQDVADKALRQAGVSEKLSGNMRVISDIAQQTNQGMKSTTESIEDLESMSAELTKTVSGFILPKTSPSDNVPLLDQSSDDESEEAAADSGGI